jgi:hypothetical protein
MKNISKSTIRKQLILKLNGLDSKLKFTNSSWNDEVKSTFNNTGSFCFENLVYDNFNTAQSLYSKFKV